MQKWAFPEKVRTWGVEDILFFLLTPWTKWKFTPWTFAFLPMDMQYLAPWTLSIDPWTMLFTLWKILNACPLDNGIFPYGQDILNPSRPLKRQIPPLDSGSRYPQKCPGHSVFTPWTLNLYPHGYSVFILWIFDLYPMDNQSLPHGKPRLPHGQHVLTPRSLSPHPMDISPGSPRTGSPHGHIAHLLGQISLI